ncbi:MAG: hypothetical protein MKZ67_10825 [Acidimicrobiales bacterium]|nr:hypothetical protein [Acidimicrobiaceae bacterium]MCH2636414.1 hypothetical protein [Acidimicrobiales bacterium]|tara:strand:+ start:498 stop:695 length:198 start_codon:yes stop_codon:yes gene_type:complete
MVFELIFVDGRAEVVSGVDNYEQEGPMTTFFQSEGRNYVDSWSLRIASYRTVDLTSVRRVLVGEQ